MSTLDLESALRRARTIIDEEPFDLSTYESCAAAALHRAAAEQHPDSALGTADAPAGEYAELLAFVCDASAFGHRVDALTALHDGLWAMMRRDGVGPREATLIAMDAAVDVAEREALTAV